jgi:hypothetical protein
MIMLVALPSVCLANNFLLEDYPATQTTFTYRYQRPNFKQDADIDLLNGFHELSLQAPLGGRVALVALLPLAHFGLGGDSRSDGEWAVGNFYLGARWGEHEVGGNTGFSAGVSLPTAETGKNQASYMGFISGSHWPQSFASDTVTLHTNVLYRYNNPSGLYVSGEIGPEAYVNTGGGGGGGGDTEFALR